MDAALKRRHALKRFLLPAARADKDHIHSGPGFVTKVNVEKMERYSGQFR